MNNVRYCGRKEVERMLANDWHLELAEFGETSEEIYERLSKRFSKVKVYYGTTCVKGYHEYFAMVKR